MNVVMNRIAERILQSEVGITYARFVFLFAIKECGTATQHQIAQAMKVSDPAVSKLCAEAVHDDLLHIAINPQHKRQRLISLTPAAQKVLARSLTALDTCFSDVCAGATVNEETYRQQTALLLDSLNNKYKEILS